jgi:DNA-binding Lrp family transcriptional regulator
MVENNGVENRIIAILKKHSQGLTILDISKKIGMSRHAITNYIYLLLGKGKIRIREVGTAKLCYLAKGRKRK